MISRIFASRGSFPAAVLFVLLAVTVTGPRAWADSTSGVPITAPGYRVPTQSMVDLIDRSPTPVVVNSPDHQWLLLMERPNLPSIEELAEPEMRLGGLRFKPSNNGPSRGQSYIGLELLRISDGSRRAIHGLPEAPRLGNVRFSPDGQHIAFTHTLTDRIEIWVVQVESGKARRLSTARLNLAARGNMAWLADSRSLVCALVLEGQGAAAEAPLVPTGPVVQANEGKKAPARTYQDLLTDAHDEALFEHYLTARMARISLDGKVTPLGEPGIVWRYSPSPDGRFLLVETLRRPFSYLVPASRFPRRVEVWNLETGKAHRVADLPLQESVPIAFGSVATGPRRFSWRADTGATLAWAEALDGGDAGREAKYRDQLFLWPAPFVGQAQTWTKLEKRFSFVLWGRDDLALVYESWWKTRNIRVSRVKPGQPDQAAKLLIDRSWEDRYTDPGSPLTTTNQWGRSVIWTDKGGETLYMTGAGASPEGNRPFFDAFDLANGKTKRLFRSEAPYYEVPIQPIDDSGRYLLTRRESVEEPPNYFVRDLQKSARPRQLTKFSHPTPELVGVHKELIRYQRADGVQLTATLYLPPGHKPEDGPLPLLMWAYPQEFKSADAAGQVTSSPFQFDRIGWWSPLLWLTQGYAVLDDPSMPIIGEDADEPNDTFRRQLVDSAKAAVDEVVARGVTQPGQIAIGGHSYGAFMTANLLAHSDLFAAGIARSGAYNRTLTPFGFQSEQRSFWEAPDVYFNMSPFMHAEKVNEPILLIHGAADNNSGTFPMQSERYYNALKGQGATARLVMLPHESHGYRARESVLHMLWETHQWLEKYVNVEVEDVPTVTRGAADRGKL